MLNVSFDCVSRCPLETAELTFASLSPWRHSDKDNFISSCLNDVSLLGPGVKKMVFNGPHTLVDSLGKWNESQYLGKDSKIHNSEQQK